MNKVISKVRVTEVDGLSDALVRLYKADEGVSSDVFLKSVMDEIEKLSVSITTAIKKDKVLSNLEEADGVRDEAVKNLSTLLDGYSVFPVAAKKEAAKKQTLKTGEKSRLRTTTLGMPQHATLRQTATACRQRRNGNGRRAAVKAAPMPEAPP